MKNFLTQWETEEEKRKISGSMPLIDKKLAELEDDAKYASLPKLIKLVKKSSNFTKIGKEKSHYPISPSLASFIGLV